MNGFRGDNVCRFHTVRGVAEQSWWQVAECPVAGRRHVGKIQ